MSTLTRALPVPLFVFVASSLTALACGTSTGVGADAGQGFQLRLAKNHRVSAEACTARAPGRPIPRPDAGIDASTGDAASPADAGPDGAIFLPPDPSEEKCYGDEDCTAGKDGRCGNYVISGSGAPRACSYSTCTQDSECKAGEACVCSSLGHSCVTSSCRIDADCKDALGCSPMHDPFGHPGYACHTEADECIDDADCATGNKNQCNFQKELGRWACQLSLQVASSRP